MKKITLTLVICFLAGMAGKMFAQTEGAFNFSDYKNYYVIYLDDETFEQIPDGRVAKDYRVDEETHFLYIWQETYAANAAIGPNSNGVPSAFLDFSVTNVGWSGFGFASADGTSGKDMTAIDNTYYFHVAFKTMGSENHLMIVGGGDDEENGIYRDAKLNIGSVPYDDNGTWIDPYKNFPRDGEWYSFDIPMSDLFKMGAVFDNPNQLGNVFSLLSGGKAGTNICIDAIFFYQPLNASSVGEISGNDVEIIVENATISAVGTEGGLELYDLSGKLVRSSLSNTLDILGLNKGIYIVKAGDIVKKVCIR